MIPLLLSSSLYLSPLIRPHLSWANALFLMEGFCPLSSCNPLRVSSPGQTLALWGCSVSLGTRMMETAHVIKMTDIIGWLGGLLRVKAGHVKENAGTWSAGSEFQVARVRNKPPRAILTLKDGPRHCRGQGNEVTGDQTCDLNPGLQFSLLFFHSK